MKPRILFILHLPPPVHGAAMVGKYIRASAIINSNFDARYINLSTSVTNEEIGKGGARKIFSFLKKVALIFKTLFSTKFDLCYMTLSTTGYGFYKDFMIVALLKLFGKKIIYHLHNKGVSSYQHKFIDNLMYRFAFNGAWCVLLSPLLYGDIAKYVKPENVYYCPNGIPNFFYNSSPKKEFNDHDRFKLLFLSNMTIEKGVIDLLEACKILKENNYSFECHFVGDWANISQEQFNLYVSRNDLSNIIFAHGKKYGKDKFDFLSSADIFVFPTFYHKECFPLVLLEAMQFSLPVVSSDEGGIPDIVVAGVTGLLVDKNNPKNLASKLSYLMDNPVLIKEMASAGKKRFLEVFTVSHFESNMYTIITQILDRKG